MTACEPAWRYWVWNNMTWQNLMYTPEFLSTAIIKMIWIFIWEEEYFSMCASIRNISIYNIKSFHKRYLWKGNTNHNQFHHKKVLVFKVLYFQEGLWPPGDQTPVTGATSIVQVLQLPSIPIEPSWVWVLLYAKLIFKFFLKEFYIFLLL